MSIPSESEELEVWQCQDCRSRIAVSKGENPAEMPCPVCDAVDAWNVKLAAAAAAIVTRANEREHDGPATE